MCFELVQMALMGLSCPFISPTGVKESTFQTLIIPPRQALSTMGRPGMKARAQTQSLWALGICCRHRAEIMTNLIRSTTSSLTHPAWEAQLLTVTLGLIWIVGLVRSQRVQAWFVPRAGDNNPAFRGELSTHPCN